jgi:hypothetical protein
VERWSNGDETGTGYFLFFKRLPVPLRVERWVSYQYTITPVLQHPI